MKKYITALVFGFVITLIFSVKVTNATVGGPTTISNLKYDPETASIYYTEQSYSGRGCPPLLKSLSYTTGQTKTIYDCNDDVSSEEQNQKIYSYTSNFNSPAHINLRKNNISLLINSGIIENYPNTSDKLKINFIARVLQNNNSIFDFTLGGCNLDQPYVVDGYSIPGVNDKIILLISGKNDCFEGGYVFERLVLVPAIQISNNATVYAYKDTSSLVPNEGSLVVYPSEATNVVTKPLKKFVWWNPFTWF